jgi:exonuclease SbcC
MKIDKITIDGFRAYESKQEFDFTNDKGKTSSLVLIYAPNGFGKTSFFDGVEWSFTGEIKRFENYVNKNNNPLAKNLLLHRNNTRGYANIDIVFDDKEVLIRRTTPVKNRNNDLTIGEYIQDDKNINNDEFKKQITKYILSQDLIGDFLRRPNTKERFDDLKIFWDYKKDSPLYEKIDEKFKEFEKSFNNKKKEYVSKKKELDKHKEDILENISLENIIESFNSLINENQIKEIEQLILKSDDFNKFISDNSSQKTKIESIVKKIENKKESILYLLNKLPLYNMNKKTLNRRIKKQEINKKIIDSFEVINNIESEQKELCYSYSKFLKANTLYKQYKRYENKIIFLNILKENLKKSIDKCKVFEVEKNIAIEKIEEIKNIDSELKNYFLIIENIKKLQKDNILFEFTNKEIYKHINNLKSSKYIYENILSIDISNNGFIKEDIKKDIIELKKSNIDKINKKKELDEIREDLKNFLKVDEKYKKLVDESIEYIQKDIKRNNCPLCNSDLKTHSNLMESIFSHTPSSTTIKTLQDKEEKLVIQIEAIESNYNKYKSKIENYTNIEIEQLSSAIKNLEFIYSKNNNKLLEKKELLEKYVQYKNNVDTFMIQKNIQIDENNLIKINNKNLNEQLEILKIEFKKYNEKIKDFQIFENKRKRIELIIENIKQKFAYKYIYNKEIINSNHIISDLDNLINRYQSNLSELSKYRKFVITIQQHKIQKIYNCQIEKIKNIKIEIENYESLYFKFDKSISEEKLIEINQKNENYLNLMNELNDISSKISSLSENNIELLRLKKELINSIKERISIRRKYSKIKKVKEKAEVFIRSKIEEAFNLPLINDIYKKIEPHPEFDEVCFEVKLDGKKSELEVKTKKFDLEVQPILYFSAAQINVLSLSIFLAKALQKKEPVLKTIFIDDPIQHLDSINILSFIDLMRILIKKDRQLVIATHDESFFELVKKKMPADVFNAKYLF